MHRCVVQVREELDVFEACRAVRELSGLIGFGRLARGELDIVVAELASNIVKHAGRGVIECLEILDAQRGAGIEITARDEGPHIRQVELAVQDGFDDSGPILPERMVKRRGWGVGLGAVVRMTDTFEHTALACGNQIRVVRYLSHCTAGQRS